MAKVDLESKLLEAIAYVKASLNAKITEINAEKADAVTLGTVEATAYLFAPEIEAQFPTHDPFVVFHIGSELGDTAGDESSIKGLLGIEVVTSDRGYASGEAVAKMLLRYKRAIREVLAAKFRSFGVLRVIDFPDVKFAAGEGQGYWSVAVGFNFNITG